jgi:DNA (cytosine-5)-methyltransferase 1
MNATHSRETESPGNVQRMVSRRPTAADLFCCAGGAAMGLHRAGFDVEGWDIAPQPRYPFRFHLEDALDADLSRFDFIWASPPCHDHSRLVERHHTNGTAWMLGATIQKLTAWGGPWIVENVEGAKWPPGVFRVRLCGSMFGLNVRRHRWFASNVAMLTPSCDHGRQPPRFRTLDNRRRGALAGVIGVHGHTNYPGEFQLRCDAMGINWMKNAELSQAIPPAYSEFLARPIAARLKAANA